MDQHSLESTLADLDIPALRFFQSIDSTNDESFRWISSGAPDHGLVIADEQTAGKGRSQRRWITQTGSGLAFSLILNSPALDSNIISRLSGLGAVAVHSALQKQYALNSQIKWPNDILLNKHKAAGVLVEGKWSGDTLQAVVIGIGINIAPESISAVHLLPEGWNFPPTCIENELGSPVDRLELLHAVLKELLSWMPRLSQPEFILEWESNLAFRDQWVELFYERRPRVNENGNTNMPSIVGKVIGLNGDGALRLITKTGEIVTVSIGEVHFQPASTESLFPPLD